MCDYHRDIEVTDWIIKAGQEYNSDIDIDKLKKTI